MIEGKTSSGFAFRVSETVKSDFRFVRKLRKLMSKKPQDQVEGLSDLVSVVFCDEEQEEQFLLHLADEHGRVPTETVFAELREILDAASAADKDIKN